MRGAAWCAWSPLERPADSSPRRCASGQVRRNEERDKHGVTKRFASPSQGSWYSQFRETTERYRIIGDQPVPILMPYGQTEKAQLDEWRCVADRVNTRLSRRPRQYPMRAGTKPRLTRSSVHRGTLRQCGPTLVSPARSVRAHWPQPVPGAHFEKNIQNYEQTAVHASTPAPDTLTYARANAGANGRHVRRAPSVTA